MKIGVYADPHFSQSSSIIVGKRGEFTGRLSNLIDSFKWMNNLFKKIGVDKIICLGDLTDKPNLTAEEITAMSKCNMESHYFIVGNHCRIDKDGKINSLANYENVISEPGWLDDDESTGVYLLPYNHDLIDLSSINPKPKIILSHNDLEGYDFGAGHISKEGYKVSDILQNCNLFVNGHLHTGNWIIPGRAVNLGNLSDMNFASCSEDKWYPSVAIIDTESEDFHSPEGFRRIENPYAYRFIKNEFKTISKLKGMIDNLEGSNYVLQVKVPEDIAIKSRKLLDQSDKIVASRVLTYHRKSKKSNEEVNKQISLNNNSVYDKLREFVKIKSPDYSLKIINSIIDEISKDEGEE